MTPDDTDIREAAVALVGNVIAGRYRIVELLGVGAMGAVYVGEHLRLGKRDAIKLLRTSIARDPEAVARFTRGARNLSAIRHPNVCTVYDFGDTADGLQFLAMELVSGETLEDVLRREGKLELNRAVDIALQIADALEAAHEADIVHRDLKPANVMLSRNADGSDAVKVVDFDIAKGPVKTEGEAVTRLGVVIGTPDYMSPEQLTDESLDGRSDIYSLGILLFRMLAGALPFHAASIQALMVQRLTTAPKRLDEVLSGATFPPGLQLVLDRALARAANERQASAAQFASELAAATGAAVVSGSSIDHRRAHSNDAVRAREAIPPTVSTPTPATGLVESVKRWLRRRPGRLAAAAIVIIAMAGGAWALAGPAREIIVEWRGARDSVPVGTVSSGESVAVDTDTSTRLARTDSVPNEGGDRDTSVAIAGSGKQREDTEESLPPKDPPPPPALPGGVAEALDRQLGALQETPGPAQLRAIRDTARIAWSSAEARKDSAMAAFVRAQAALLVGNDAECREWAVMATDLGATSANTVQQACG